MVFLRAVRRADLEFFLRWLNDVEVMRYLVVFYPMNEIAEEKWIEEMCIKNRDKDVFFVICAWKDGKEIPIGSCGLHNINWKDRDAEAGIVIGEKEYWEKGYGTEAASLLVEYAFNYLNLHRVSAGAYSFNERSIRMQKKIGFQLEGCVRSSIFKNGKYYDKMMLGILSEEWLAKNSK